DRAWGSRANRLQCPQAGNRGTRPIVYSHLRLSSVPQASHKRLHLSAVAFLGPPSRLRATENRVDPQSFEVLNEGADPGGVHLDAFAAGGSAPNRAVR